MIRGIRTDPDSQYASVPGSESGDGSSELEDFIDEEKLLLYYKNTYWTKLMVIGDYEADHDRKWPLGPDLVEEC